MLIAAPSGDIKSHSKSISSCEDEEDAEKEQLANKKGVEVQSGLHYGGTAAKREKQFQGNISNRKSELLAPLNHRKSEFSPYSSVQSVHNATGQISVTAPSGDIKSSLTSIYSSCDDEDAGKQEQLANNYDGKVQRGLSYSRTAANRGKLFHGEGFNMKNKLRAQLNQRKSQFSQPNSVQGGSKTIGESKLANSKNGEENADQIHEQPTRSLKEFRIKGRIFRLRSHNIRKLNEDQDETKIASLSNHLAPDEAIESNPQDSSLRESKLANSKEGEEKKDSFHEEFTGGLKELREKNFLRVTSQRNGILKKDLNETRILPLRSQNTRKLKEDLNETRILPLRSQNTKKLKEDQDETRILPLRSQNTRRLKEDQDEARILPLRSQNTKKLKEDLDKTRVLPLRSQNTRRLKEDLDKRRIVPNPARNHLEFGETIESSSQGSSLRESKLANSKEEEENADLFHEDSTRRLKELRDKNILRLRSQKTRRLKEDLDKRRIVPVPPRSRLEAGKSINNNPQGSSLRESKLANSKEEEEENKNPFHGDSTKGLKEFQDKIILPVTSQKNGRLKEDLDETKEANEAIVNNPQGNSLRESNSKKRKKNADPLLEAFFKRLEKNEEKIRMSQLNNLNKKSFNEYLDKTSIVRQSNRIAADEAIENNPKRSSLRESKRASSKKIEEWLDILHEENSKRSKEDEIEVPEKTKTDAMSNHSAADETVVNNHQESSLRESKRASSKETDKRIDFWCEESPRRETQGQVPEKKRTDATRNRLEANESVENNSQGSSLRKPKKEKSEEGEERIDIWLEEVARRSKEAQRQVPKRKRSDEMRNHLAVVEAIVSNHEGSNLREAKRANSKREEESLGILREESARKFKEAQRQVPEKKRPDTKRNRLAADESSENNSKESNFRESKRENSKDVEEPLGILHEESARRFKEAQTRVTEKKRTDAMSNHLAANKVIVNNLPLRNLGESKRANSKKAEELLGALHEESARRFKEAQRKVPEKKRSDAMRNHLEADEAIVKNPQGSSLREPKLANSKEGEERIDIWLGEVAKRSKEAQRQVSKRRRSDEMRNHLAIVEAIVNNHEENSFREAKRANFKKAKESLGILREESARRYKKAQRQVPEKKIADEMSNHLAADEAILNNPQENSLREAKRPNSKKAEESLGALHEESAKRYKEAQKQVPDRKRTDAKSNHLAADKSSENKFQGNSLRESKRANSKKVEESLGILREESAKRFKEAQRRAPAKNRINEMRNQLAADEAIENNLQGSSERESKHANSKESEERNEFFPKISNLRQVPKRKRSDEMRNHLAVVEAIVNNHEGNFLRESKHANSKKAEESLGILREESARRFKEAQKQVPDKKRSDAMRNHLEADQSIVNNPQGSSLRESKDANSKKIKEWLGILHEENSRRFKEAQKQVPDKKRTDEMSNYLAADQSIVNNPLGSSMRESKFTTSKKVEKWLGVMHEENSRRLKKAQKQLPETKTIDAMENHLAPDEAIENNVQESSLLSSGIHPLPQYQKQETPLVSKIKTPKEKMSSKSTEISNPNLEEMKSRNKNQEAIPKTDNKVEKSDPKNSEAIPPQPNQIKKIFQDLKIFSNKHVMLSYQHEYQPLVLQIRKRLVESGYKTWMDVHDMRDNLIKGMQYGVENSAAFIMCMSKSYQNSKNCQKEAMYASEKLDSDDIIPIYVEKDFKAKKWLEFVKAGILYMELTTDTYDDDFHKKLVNRLGKRGMT